MTQTTFFRNFCADKRRILLGTVLGILSLAVFCLFYTWQTGLAFAVLFLVAGCLKIRTRHPISGFLINGAWGVISIFISCVLPTIMVSDASYLEIGHYRIVMNFLCAAVVYGLCLVLTGRLKSAVAVASFLLLILATVNNYVFQFRGTLLKPMDFLFARTAMNVAGEYTYTISEALMQCWMIWIWSMFFQGSLPEEKPVLPGAAFRAAAVLATAACVVVLWNGTKDIKHFTWSNEGVTYNGYFLNFTVGLRDFFVEAPEGYSAEAVAQLEQAYSGEEAAEDRSYPNILVIMNESFADLNVLGTELRTNQPVTPFVDSLQENVIRGYALTSIFGGGTANAELELLTGLSMANAPDSSIPYQQYITEPLFSMPHYLRSLGYRTLSTHPYLASGWNRSNVYPLLGFSESTFLEAYPSQDLVREFVSDREMYRFLLDLLSEDADAPLFLFGITMQNHGDYIYEGPNYEQNIFLEGYDMDHPMTEQYLSLLHESDRAVEDLLRQLENFPEDTIVLFFGDHLPQIEGDFLLEAHGGVYETLDEQQLQYTVPFFIWANFPISEETVECTSLNYLGRYLLETAGIPLPPMWQFLKELEDAIPAINANGYYSCSEGRYLPLQDAQGEEKRWLEQYAIVQYNSMFDTEMQSDHFFKQYITVEPVQ